MPDRYRETVDQGAGCGLRQGEIFAVSPDDVDATRPISSEDRIRRAIDTAFGEDQAANGGPDAGDGLEPA